jgi:hypothetical protein
MFTKVNILIKLISPMLASYADGSKWFPGYKYVQPIPVKNRPTRFPGQTRLPGRLPNGMGGYN